MRVKVSTDLVTPDPSRRIGEGGEADVYDIGSGRVLKLFKGPDHPDFSQDKGLQETVRNRISEHQTKLKDFPSSLPSRVIAPLDLALSERGSRVVGYTMRKVENAEVLLRYGDRIFREGKVSSAQVVSLFLDLHESVRRLHEAGVVIGDFNDLNVLASRDHQEAYLIDADSWQWGHYLTRVYTERFLDPTLYPKNATRPELGRPYTPDSDWYAFQVMLMKSLLYVDPYGGVYRPKERAQKVAEPKRPLKRITIWHPEVIYPKPALPYHLLPDELLSQLHRTFVEDRRGVFPRGLLESLEWRRCSTCGLEHARPTCPSCQQTSPARVREVVRIRGTVKATRLLRTEGLIVHAAVQNGTLQHLVYEQGAFKREDGRVIFQGSPDPTLRVRFRGAETVVGQGKQAVVLKMSGAIEPFSVDAPGGRAAFDTSASSRVWAFAGSLYREGAWGAERIGGVMAEQTHLWMGESFGLGLYRAQEMTVGLVFSAQGKGLNDAVPLPRMPGQQVHAFAHLSTTHAWLFFAHREQGREVWRAVVIRPDGTRAALQETDDQEESAWMRSARGALATGSALFVPTDEGVVRMGVENDRVVRTAEFPDTEPFVDSQSRLLPAPEGLYVVGAHEISRLEIRSK